MRRWILAVSLALTSTFALAEDAPAPAPADLGATSYATLEQKPLTEDQVKRYIASIGDMQAAMGDAPADAPEPDAKTMAKLEDISKKYGFRDFNEYNTVAGNLAIVVDGIDPETKSYVGVDSMIKKSIAETQADAKLSESDKKAVVDDLNSQLKTVTPVKYKENIALAVKYYDKLGGDAAPAAK